MDSRKDNNDQSNYLRMATVYLLEGAGLIFLIDGSMSDRVGEGLLGISTYLVARAAGDFYRGLFLKEKIKDENKKNSQLEEKVNQ